MQTGGAIGKSNNFFVVGAMFSYSPQFANTTVNGTTTTQSATKCGRVRGPATSRFGFN